MINKKFLISLLFLFLLSVLMMMRQLTTHGYFSVTINDTFTYTSWAWQFVEALKEGIIYPRWTPLSFWNYGSPSFVLYPPLAFYIVAFFNLFTNSVIAAMNITKLTSLFFSAAGMFFLVKEFYSEKIALLTASFFIVFPYFLSNYYLFGGFASVISYMWFSPILLFAWRYFEKGQYRNLIYAGVYYGALVLTHLINAYMFTFVLLAFLIYMLFDSKNLKNLIAIPIIFLTGFLISSAYVLPLIFEKQYFNLKAFIGEGGGFHYGHFFILPKLTQKLPPDHFWPVYYYSTVFYLFLFITLLLLFLYQTRQLRYEESMRNVNIMNKFFLGAVIVSIFLSFGISTFLWETIPFIKYIQFPTRWFNITAYSLIFLSAVNFSAPDTIYKSKKGYFIIFILFLTCFLLSVKYVKSAPYFPEQELIPVQSVDLTREHLPAWVNIKTINDDDAIHEKTTIIKGEGKVKIVAWKTAERFIEINANGAMTLRIRTFYFPGWRAFIDNQEVTIKKEDGTGAIIIAVPSGRHFLKLVFADTPVRYYSKIIALVSFLAVFAIFLSSNLRNRSGGLRYL
jgi:6-pyruvoyl-tetrahydropterin synthase related domain